jgi:hypothetical protein
MKLLGIISVGFDVTDQLQIRSFAFVRYLLYVYNMHINQKRKLCFLITYVRLQGKANPGL